MTLTNSAPSFRTPTFVIDRSILRNADAPRWTNAIDFLDAGDATITASVIAGRAGASQSMRASQSVFVGTVSSEAGIFINNVLLPELLAQSTPFLRVGRGRCGGDFVCDDALLGAPEVRNNFFATTGATLPLVTSAWRTDLALGDLPSDALNNGVAWFGAAGLVGGNQFNTQLASQLFFSTDPSPAFQVRFQPRAGSPLLMAGTALYNVGNWQPKVDMLGALFPQSWAVNPPNVGAFAGPGL